MKSKDLKPTSLIEGEAPSSKPQKLIYPENVHSRRCTKCNKLHDFGIFETDTGKCIERFDLCHDCWWEGKYEINKNIEIYEKLKDTEKNIAKKVEKAVSKGTELLIQFEQEKIEPEIAFAVLGNAFTRLAGGLGHTKKTFKSLCIEMIKISELPED